MEQETLYYTPTKDIQRECTNILALLAIIMAKSQEDRKKTAIAMYADAKSIQAAMLIDETWMPDINYDASCLPGTADIEILILDKFLSILKGFKAGIRLRYEITTFVLLSLQYCHAIMPDIDFDKIVKRG